MTQLCRIAEGENKVQHIFLVGAKSLGAYGGYETFINKLTEYHQNNSDIKYHVAVKANGQGSGMPDGAVRCKDGYTYHNAECFEISIPERLGAAQAIYYDCAVLKKSIEIIKQQKIKEPIVYIMTCRIGPFFNHYARRIKALGGKVFLNPDGHEWMRAKWSAPVRKYWKYSEKKMVLGSDLIVGRFVPENNYETMIKEYMKSHTNKDFAIITNSDEKFLNELEQRLHFSKDARIKFVGTVYDQELLKKIREGAYGYFHGHEVGGTNPSLLEALGSTNLNLLLDVGFNREVAQDAAMYWTKDDGNLAQLIDNCENIDRKQIGNKAKERIKTAYSWEFISERYNQIWNT